MIRWINEAIKFPGASLKDSGSSYFIRFEAPLDTVQLIWDKIKAVAALYDAATSCCQKESLPFPSQSALMMTFQIERDAPCEIEMISPAVRHILNGNSNMRIPCHLGSCAEFDEVCRNTPEFLEGKPLATWEDYYHKITGGNLDGSEVDMKAIRSLYANVSDD